MAVIDLCNIMRSHDQSRDRSNLMKIILYLPKVDFSLVIRHLIYLTFSVNFLNQSFDQSRQLTFLLNWRRHELVIRCFL